MTIATTGTVAIDGAEIFYREAGAPDAPAVVLLHGFPTSSHMYRNLIPQLADSFHVIAPDLPGFGFTKTDDGFVHDFATLANAIDAFLEAKGIARYALMVFDYGAPVGFRIALKHPERVTAIVSQNGNAYEEGLSEGWNPIQNYWQDPSEENRLALRGFLAPETVQWQYSHGTSEGTPIAPESYTLDSALLARPGNETIQLDLFGAYASNVALYPAFQAYLRDNQPPLLAVWGRNDPFFLPPGAEAFTRDVPAAEIHFFETGHFALETHAQEIGAVVRAFLGRVLTAA